MKLIEPDDIDPLAPAKGLIHALMIMAVLIALAMLLTGCGSTREESSREVQIEQTTTRTGPIVADTPVGPVTIQPSTVIVERRQTTTGAVSSKTEYEAPLVSAAISAAVPALGIGGPLAGIAGAAFGAWRMFKERQSNQALKATVDGLEDFKAGAPSKDVEMLHDCLSKRMDVSHKQLIRKAKS